MMGEESRVSKEAERQSVTFSFSSHRLSRCVQREKYFRWNDRLTTPLSKPILVLAGFFATLYKLLFRLSLHNSFIAS